MKPFLWTNQPPLEDVMRDWWNRSSEEDRIKALRWLGVCDERGKVTVRLDDEPPSATADTRLRPDAHHRPRDHQEHGNARHHDAGKNAASGVLRIPCLRGHAGSIPHASDSASR